MYENALILHSFLRWIALLAVAHAFLLAMRGWLGNHPRGKGDRVATLIATIAVDVQLVLGFVIYFAWSPSVQNAMKDMGSAMKDKELRFWAVEHVTMMFLAVAIVHLAKVLALKGKTDVARHRRAAIGFGIALALMIFGTPWPGRAVERPLFRT